ncbi:hypothetical protein, partial [Serratia marcescens]|uniref:hypothetical protein n=1 Tax=Serratia marcescens TaxID=615 RepID=UPI001952B354
DTAEIGHVGRGVGLGGLEAAHPGGIDPGSDGECSINLCHAKPTLLQNATRRSISLESRNSHADSIASFQTD